MKPKQKVQSLSFQTLWLDLVGELSFRRSANVLNRLLHRKTGTCVSSSTLEERTESFGKSLSEAYTSQAESIHKAYNIHDGLITSDSTVSPSVLTPQLPAVIDEKQVRHLITEYNRGKDTRNKLKYGDMTCNIESSTQSVCYISIDDIGVKHQKPSRKGKKEKSRKYTREYGHPYSSRGQAIYADSNRHEQSLQTAYRISS